ncbi:hypothetical protein V8F06_005720 [Rhypophila decipiens]
MASTGGSSSNSASSPSGGANTAAPAPAQEDHDHIWNKEIKTAFELKPRSEFLDPCQEAAQRSIRCLNRNDGDRTFCQDYFQAYRDCKKHWNEASRARYYEIPPRNIPNFQFARRSERYVPVPIRPNGTRERERV